MHTGTVKPPLLWQGEEHEVSAVVSGIRRDEWQKDKHVKETEEKCGRLEGKKKLKVGNG